MWVSTRHRILIQRYIVVLTRHVIIRQKWQGKGLAEEAGSGMMMDGGKKSLKWRDAADMLKSRPTSAFTTSAWQTKPSIHVCNVCVLFLFCWISWRVVVVCSTLIRIAALWLGLVSCITYRIVSDPAIPTSNQYQPLLVAVLSMKSISFCVIV